MCQLAVDGKNGAKLINKNKYAVTIGQGDTVDKRVGLFVPCGYAFDSTDRAVLMIKDCKDNLVFSTVQVPEQDGNGYYVRWSMSHEETSLLQGEYRWGLAIYDNALLDEGGFPISGAAVKAAVPSAPFIVQDVVAL